LSLEAEDFELGTPEIYVPDSERFSIGVHRFYRRMIRVVEPVSVSTPFELRPEWQHQGSCNDPQFDPEWWFPLRGQSPTRAISICMECPVRQPCLDDAISAPDNPKGVWGGKSEKARRALRREERTTRTPEPVPPKPERLGDPRRRKQTAAKLAEGYCRYCAGRDHQRCRGTCTCPSPVCPKNRAA
jgi:WhiB family redox-sensing transcriptional regulator